MSPTSTREQMVDGAVVLFQRQGYRATSWRTLVRDSGTPWGSVQHHFPGGKEELGVAAVARGGELVAALLQATLDAAPDVATGVRDWFTGSAALLDAGEGGCPVAPVVLEMAAESPALAEACAEALDGWVAVVAASLRGAGVEHEVARGLAVTVIAGFEGALVLGRSRGSSEQLLAVGAVLAETVERHLPAGGSQAG